MSKALSELSDGQLKRLFLRLSVKEMLGTSDDDPQLCKVDSYTYLFEKDSSEEDCSGCADSD